jgi:hypothetical protein
MLHHVSFNVRDPGAVAPVLAELLGAAALRAPSPPFPAGAWFVCCGDECGTLIEVMPWGEVRDPGTPGGAGHDPAMRPHSGAHILAGTPHAVEAVLAVAARAGWRAELASAGLFSFVKVWVENAVLVELLTPEQAPAYREAFNARGLTTLDAKLRDLEAALAARRPASSAAGG